MAVAARMDIRPSQLVLPIEEIERTFDLDEYRQAFVREYVTNGNDGAAAVRAAREAAGKPRMKSAGAEAVAAHRLLRQEEVARAIAVRRKAAALKAQLSEEEFFIGLRSLLHQSLGEARVRKTALVTTVEKAPGDGEEELREKVAMDLEVYDPNPAAAGKALEMMGRALGVFKDATKLEAGDGLVSAFASLIQPSDQPPSELPQSRRSEGGDERGG